MRKLFLLFSATAFFVACNNDTDTSDASKVKYNETAAEMLKGDISSYEETPYKTDSAGKPGEIDSCCTGTAIIDENGNYTSWTDKDSKGTVKTVGTYSHYEDGLFKSYATVTDGKLSDSLMTEVDDKGQYTIARNFDSTGKLAYYYTGLSQNKWGSVTSWKEYDKDSVFRQESESKFDSSLQISFVRKDSVGKVKTESAFKYNDKGEQVEAVTKTVTKDSTTTAVKKYTYESHDEMGNWTQRTEWNDKGKAVKVLKRTYVYRKPEEKK